MCLQFQKLVSYHQWEAWQHAGRYGAREITDLQPDLSAERERDSGLCMDFWNLKAHCQLHTSSDEVIPLNLSNPSK